MDRGKCVGDVGGEEKAINSHSERKVIGLRSMIST